MVCAPSSLNLRPTPRAVPNETVRRLRVAPTSTHVLLREGTTHIVKFSCEETTRPRHLRLLKVRSIYALRLLACALALLCILSPFVTSHWLTIRIITSHLPDDIDLVSVRRHSSAPKPFTYHTLHPAGSPQQRIQRFWIRSSWILAG